MSVSVTVSVSLSETRGRETDVHTHLWTSGHQHANLIQHGCGLHAFLVYLLLGGSSSSAASSACVASSSSSRRGRGFGLAFSTHSAASSIRLIYLYAIMVRHRCTDTSLFLQTNCLEHETTYLQENATICQNQAAPFLGKY